MLTALVSRFLTLVLGILNPAYKSYKSLRNKNQKEIVTWLMYWIVFAMYSAVETFTDILLCWLPFYYEVKICFVLWLVLPVTRGYSVIFRRIIHPELQKREIEIDEIIEKASEKGYTAMLNFGAKGINYAASAFITTAVRGHEFLSSRSLSMGDLTQRSAYLPYNDPSQTEVDGVFDDLDQAISEHGDEPDVRIRNKSKSKQTYDTGTFPRRRPRTVGGELYKVPEEDPGPTTDISQENRSERGKISQIYLNAISKRPQAKSTNHPFLRSQSECIDQNVAAKPPIYRPSA